MMPTKSARVGWVVLVSHGVPALANPIREGRHAELEGCIVDVSFCVHLACAFEELGMSRMTSNSVCDM